MSACAINWQGIGENCSTNVGGVNAIILIQRKDMKKSTGSVIDPGTIYVTDESGNDFTLLDMPLETVSGTTNALPPQSLRYAVRYTPTRNSAKVNSSESFNLTDGSASTSTTISMTFANLDTYKLWEYNQLREIRYADDVVGFYRTNAGDWYYIGAFNGLQITALSTDHGSNLTDGSTLSVTITDIGPYPPLICEPTFGAKLTKLYNWNT